MYDENDGEIFRNLFAHVFHAHSGVSATNGQATHAVECQRKKKKQNRLAVCQMMCSILICPLLNAAVFSYFDGRT